MPRTLEEIYGYGPDKKFVGYRLVDPSRSWDIQWIYYRKDYPMFTDQEFLQFVGDKVSRVPGGTTQPVWLDKNCSGQQTNPKGIYHDYWSDPTPMMKKLGITNNKKSMKGGIPMAGKKATYVGKDGKEHPDTMLKTQYHVHIKRNEKAVKGLEKAGYNPDDITRHRNFTCSSYAKAQQVAAKYGRPGDEVTITKNRRDLAVVSTPQVVHHGKLSAHPINPSKGEFGETYFFEQPNTVESVKGNGGQAIRKQRYQKIAKNATTGKKTSIKK